MLQLLCSLGKVVIEWLATHCWQIANNIQYMNVHYYCVQNYLNATYICWSFVWTGKRQFLIWKFTQNLLLNTLGPLINYADKSQFFTYISIHADYYINKNLTYALNIQKQFFYYKGQLDSEWIYEVIVSPKMPTKNYQDFYPGSLS